MVLKNGNPFQISEIKNPQTVSNDEKQYKKTGIADIVPRRMMSISPDSETIAIKRNKMIITPKQKDCRRITEII